MTRDTALDLAIAALRRVYLEAIAVLTQMQGDLAALPMFVEREVK